MFTLVDGRLYWAVKPRWSRRKQGDEVGWICNGYRRARVDGGNYRLHHLVWAIHYGVWPEVEIDHINGVRDDNRVENLRESTHAENLCNRGATAANKCGIKGVSWSKAANKWKASIRIKGVQTHLGVHSDIQDAAAAYVAAAKKHHGVFHHS